MDSTSKAVADNLNFSIFFSEGGGGGKKGGKKKGSSFQTVSALFRVQYDLESQGNTFIKKLNFSNRRLFNISKVKVKRY
jgi:hypothetical protein